MFEYINGFIERKEVVEMIYQSESGLITQRKVTIYAKTDQHMKAYCHLRKRVRVFKLKNVLSIQPCRQRKFR